MIFGVAELISFCSHSFTLEPGDVILTGTPWGCGEFMEPKRSLRHGDVVECEIEGIGVLRNPVVEICMKVHLPTSVDEVLGLLGEGVPRRRLHRHLSRVWGRPSRSSACARPGLDGVSVDGDRVTVGATTTLTELAREVPFLRESIASIASPTIRNMATVGGNLFAPQPHGDLAVCLLALDAQIEKTEATSSPASASRSPSAGSTARRCAASRTARRS